MRAPEPRSHSWHGALGPAAQRLQWLLWFKNALDLNDQSATAVKCQHVTELYQPAESLCHKWLLKDCVSSWRWNLAAWNVTPQESWIWDWKQYWAPGAVPTSSAPPSSSREGKKNSHKPKWKPHHSKGYFSLMKTELLFNNSWRFYLDFGYEIFTNNHKEMLLVQRQKGGSVWSLNNLELHQGSAVHWQQSPDKGNNRMSPQRLRWQFQLEWREWCCSWDELQTELEQWQCI